MDIRRGFIPSSKRPIADIHLDTLCRGTKPGILPIMNGPGTVCGEMRQPIIRHHSFKDKRGAVAQQVSSIYQHHRRTPFACRANLAGTFLDPSSILLRARFCRFVGIDQDLVDGCQAVSLGKWQNFQLAKIEWGCRLLGFHRGRSLVQRHGTSRWTFD